MESTSARRIRSDVSVCWGDSIRWSNPVVSTEEEADSLRTANSNEDFDEVVRRIRVRHVTAGLSAAVEAGDMTAEEADRVVERLRSGEHPTGLRANLRRHRAGTRRASS